MELLPKRRNESVPNSSRKEREAMTACNNTRIWWRGARWLWTKPTRVERATAGRPYAKP
jgi:uncharacterized protein with PIN domain